MGSGVYRPRIVDSQVAEELEAVDAIEIRGANGWARPPPQSSSAKVPST